MGKSDAVFLVVDFTGIGLAESHGAGASPLHLTNEEPEYNRKTNDEEQGGQEAAGERYSEAGFFDLNVQANDFFSRNTVVAQEFRQGNRRFFLDGVFHVVSGKGRQGVFLDFYARNFIVVNFFYECRYTNSFRSLFLVQTGGREDGSDHKQGQDQNDQIFGQWFHK